jgi:hypothetical protein
MAMELMIGQLVAIAGLVVGHFLAIVQNRSGESR